MADDKLARLSTELVPENPLVAKIALRLRWRPETAIRRIEKALPARIEQEIYLKLGSDFGIHPESMAKLLRFYLGEENLLIEDLDPKPIGNNLVSSKFTNFAEFLQACLYLLKLVGKEFTSFSISIEHAAMIVSHYGTENPEALIEMIDGNLEELCEMLAIGNDRTYEFRMRTCIWLIVTKVFAENKNSGRPDILDLAEILDVIRDRSREMRRALLDADPTDYLAAPSSELRNHPERELLIAAGVFPGRSRP
jgi:hypothetical protein